VEGRRPHRGEKRGERRERIRTRRRHVRILV
jgi:hypothetical protein